MRVFSLINTVSEQGLEMKKTNGGIMPILWALLVVVLGGILFFFVYNSSVSPDSKYPFKLGLDLAGGTHLVYEADVSTVPPAEVPELMGVLRDVIERRINIFGVSEPIVQVESSSFVAGEEHERLVVELPGVTDVDAAVAEIGRTPLLEFKLVDTSVKPSGTVDENGVLDLGVDTAPSYIDTGLTGRYLKRAELVFGKGSGSLSNEPIVSVSFTDEGGELFKTITTEHTGELLAIFLDGEVVSSPRIDEPIAGGKAVISGNFTADEARDLVQNLNFGALPLPITLQSTETIGASLGGEILSEGVTAGAIGLALVLAFMLLWYRLPGVVAGIALIFYGVLMLALFKVIPVTLTAAGLAGFILSVGMAVDANVLVFERMKEEYKQGKSARAAARAGFARAFPAIRDGNATSLLSAIILFWFGTSIVKGFALVFGVGVIVSMFTALVVTRTLLMVLPDAKETDDTFVSKLFNVGFNK